MGEATGAAREGLGAALGRVPSGLFVLTARDDGRPHGILASWVQQAGFEPPMVTVAVQLGRPVAAALDATGRFALNQVPSGQRDLMKRFSRPAGPDSDPFDGLEVRDGAAGGAVLGEALAFLDCRVVGSVDSGDHRIYLAEIEGGEVLAADGAPFVHVRKNGFHY